MNSLCKDPSRSYTEVLGRFDLTPRQQPLGYPSREPTRNVVMVSDETMEIFVAVAEMNENIEKLRLETKGDLLRLEDRISGEISRLDEKLFREISSVETRLGGRIDKLDQKTDEIQKSLSKIPWYILGAIVVPILLKLSSFLLSLHHP